MVCYLLAPVDDVLGEWEASHTGPPHHAVVAGGGVGHLHGGELQETLAQGNTAQQQLPANTKSFNPKWIEDTEDIDSTKDIT